MKKLGNIEFGKAQNLNSLKKVKKEKAGKVKSYESLVEKGKDFSNEIDFNDKVYDDENFVKRNDKEQPGWKNMEDFENVEDPDDKTEFNNNESDENEGYETNDSIDKKIEEVKARIKYYDNGNVASIGPEVDDSDSINNHLDFKSDKSLKQPEIETVASLEDYDLDNGYVSTRSRAHGINPTTKEVNAQKNKSWHSGHITSRDLQHLKGDYSPQPHENLKTMAPKKKERYFRGLLSKILGKTPWVKGEKFEKQSEKMKREEDFYNGNLIEEEGNEHPMRKYWPEKD